MLHYDGYSLLLRQFGLMDNSAMFPNPGKGTSSASDLPTMDNSPVPISQPSNIWTPRPNSITNKDTSLSPMDGLIRSAATVAKDSQAEGNGYYRIKPSGPMGRPISVPSPNMYPQNITSVSRHDNLIHPHNINSTSSSQGLLNSGPSPLVVPQPVAVKVPRPNKTYHCRMCDQIFDSKSDLMVHSQHIHKQDPKPYKCQKCNKCFANSSYLSQHARIHLGIKPYKCQICERKFTQLCHLQQHMRTHTGEKPYKCQHPGCGKAFTQLSNLQSHSRSHMTDKPYRCNSCYKCYADEQSLREHIPKHSETKHLKTHICHICGKSYTQETYLTRHMAKHSFDNRGPPGLGVGPGGVNVSVGSSIGKLGAPMLGGQMGPDQVDIKPQIEGNGLASPDIVSGSGKQSSAFMPLAHQYPGPNMINSSVPSNFPFPPPRLPSSTLSSPLPHISSVTPSRAYFPFDPVSFPKREPPERSISVSRESMITNSLLSLQQIKNYTSTHPMFSKSEPNSPVHNKEFT